MGQPNVDRALLNGSVSVELMDTRLRQLLRTQFRLGFYNEPDTLRLMSSNQHARAWCECVCLPGSADSSPQNIYGLVA